MALPVTITGISTAVACVGPFKASNGNFYFFGRDGTTSTTLQAYRASDPTSSWASVATNTGFTTNIQNLSGFQSSDVISLIVADGSATVINYKYRTFNMATNSFVTSETIAASLTTAGVNVGTQNICSIVVRSGDGHAIAFFNGAQIKQSGSFRARVYYSERTASSTWTAPVEVDAGGANDYQAGPSVLNGSDRTHFLYCFALTVNALERSLSSNSSLDTSQNIISSGTISLPVSAILYNSSGTDKVIVSHNDTTGVWNSYFDSSSNPTISDNPNITSLLWVSRLFNDGTTAYLTALESNNDLFVVNSTNNGASWSSATNIFTASITTGSDVVLSKNGNVYQSGNNVVIPYVVNDGGTIKYNEWTLRTVTAFQWYPMVTDGSENTKIIKPPIEMVPYHNG